MRVTAEQRAMNAGIAVLLLGGLVIIALLVADRIDFEDSCKQRGGIPYCAYKSECVCLAREMVR